MKTGIHPKYNENIVIECACGHKFLAGSTKDKITTEICSNCHPHYTGISKIIDTAGRVEKYMAKIKKAQKKREEAVKIVDEEMDEMFEEGKKAEQTALIEDEAEQKPVKKAAAKKTATAKKPAAKKTSAKAKK